PDQSSPLFTTADLSRRQPSMPEGVKSQGAPRTRKGALCRQSSRVRCCAEDEGLALRSRPAGGGFKPPHAAAVTAVRGERCGNGADRGVRWGSGRRPLSTCRYLTSGGIKTGEILCDPGAAWRVPADWPGGVRHGGDVSLICCFRMERGKGRPDTATRQGGDRERPKRQQPQGTEYRCGACWRTGS